MIAISPTELKRNLYKYLEQAQSEQVIIQCKNAETYAIVPTGKTSETDRLFLHQNIKDRLRHSLEQVKEGKTYQLTKAEINSFLGHYDDK
uniref:Uncharacterized protein n=1 Tax=Chlorobium chlorochromatii (strain CaD3) TaxID=340177 RepID=Q3ARA3_CHLCH